MLNKGMTETKKTTKAREGMGTSPADFQVCFPSKPHLTLSPNPFCSPAQPGKSGKRNHHHHHCLNKYSNRGGHASPSLWANTNLSSLDITEPTSPKVTCAGKIKVRPKNKSRPSKNWQTVIEEIEKIHNNKRKKRPKKDMMQMFSSIRGFQIRRCCSCLGKSTNAIFIDANEQESQVGNEHSDGSGASRAIFSKWFVVLQENRKGRIVTEEECKGKGEREPSSDEKLGTLVPPSNALLLMRCRSAPAESLVEHGNEEETEKASPIFEQENTKENMIMKCYAPDLLKVNSDISNERWLVGGMKDPLSRSRRWRRCS